MPARWCHSSRSRPAPRNGELGRHAVLAAAGPREPLTPRDIARGKFSSGRLVRGARGEQVGGRSGSKSATSASTGGSAGPFIVARLGANRGDVLWPQRLGGRTGSASCGIDASFG